MLCCRGSEEVERGCGKALGVPHWDQGGEALRRLCVVGRH